jgi:ABC-2 type transport system permease protein
MKEILRDPITSLLGILLPIIFIVLFTMLGKRAPLDIFEIDKLTPAIIAFGFSFLTMFSATLMAKDKKSAFLDRLFASPLTASDYIISYTLPLLPIALMQCIVCFVVAIMFGLQVTINMVVTMVVLLPIALLFIFMGLLFGTTLNTNQISGLGSMFITLSAIFSGAWMDLNMIGGVFETIGYSLPFAHAVDAARYALAGEYSMIFPHLVWVIGYMLVLFVIAVFAFKRKMIKV